MQNTIEAVLRALARYIIQIMIFLSAMLFFIIGLSWLWLGLILLISLYFLAINIFKSHKAGMILMFITIPLFFRCFVFEIRNIPSSSMEDTLLPGDYVLMSKLSYGPRFLNLFSNGPAEYRLPGLSAIERNDVVVFEHPVDERFLVKRIIGMPGDTLEIRDNTVLINQRKAKPLPNVKYSYQVWIRDSVKFNQMAHELGIYYNQRKAGKKIYVRCILTKTERMRLSASANVDSISGDPLFPAKPILQAGGSSKWTGENFGPILIPPYNKPMRISRDREDLYKAIAERFEPILFPITKIPNQDQMRPSVKTFREHYFFVLGDNRNHSVDSRFFGFLPAQCIQGKVICVLFSFDKQGWNWKRTFKIL